MALNSESSLSSYCDSGVVFKSEYPATGIEKSLERTVTIGDSINDDEFSCEGVRGERYKDDEEAIKKLEISERPQSPPLHLAAKLGFDLPDFDDENCDDYYKTMLEEYPLNPLLLKNYAKFLEYKGDLSGAEEYYHKCALVEPCDGVALANYGRLVMKLHYDETKAMSYFERAVQASPEDNNVLGAYASFLWEIDADDEDKDEDEDSFRDLTGQEKEELEPDAAEKSNSSLSKTEDGETLCRYAKAFWNINGDHEKALVYFEKAIEASPNDSIILGEYAKFLWEIEE